MNSSILASTIAGATSVRVTRVGEFDPRQRGRTTATIVTSDLGQVDRVRRCLEADDGSLAEDSLLMTPGVLDLNFSAGHELLATITYIYPDFIRWRGWSSDARLINSANLIAWLVDHGWRPPSQ